MSANPPRLYTHSSAVVDQRSLATDHRDLAALLRPGMRVLDSGCATGTMTAGMADAVGPEGSVLGTDHNREFLDTAARNYGDRPNLRFAYARLEDLGEIGPFDVATSARTLQWMADAMAGLREMVRVTKTGGLVNVLDYSHGKLRWHPAVPASQRRFYDAWLAWRASDGLDNDIADHLERMFATAGLVDIRVSVQHEAVRRGDATFEQKAGIWLAVRNAFGKALIDHGLLSQAELDQAASDYGRWIANEGQLQEMYLLSVTGRKP